MHPGQMVGQGGQEARAVLAGRAMDQNRAVALGQGGEVAGIEVDQARLEGIALVPAAAAGAEELDGRIGALELLFPRFADVADVVLDHRGGEARPAA